MIDFIKDNFIPRIPKDNVSGNSNGVDGDGIPLFTNIGDEDFSTSNLQNNHFSSANDIESGDVHNRVGHSTTQNTIPINGNKFEDKDEKDNISVYTQSTNSTTESEHLHRSLKSFQIQIIAVSGVIGSALFVAIGKALAKGGPLSLLLAFVLWSIPILCITISTAEFVSYLPITSPFIRMAGRCCDDALQVMAAWNFWILCCAQIPFEVVTVNSIIHFWRDDYSPAITLSIQVLFYFLINLFEVSVYGYIEFGLGLGKVILAVGLILYSFVTMVGGNPQKDVYGFRYWRNPGPMAEYIDTGTLGRFEGFLACLIQATFTMAGPEYLSSVASETINPRKVLPSAFKQVFWRLAIFFIGGALAVGIIIPYNDPTLVETMGASKPGAGSSPYVISMQNLGITVLPDIVNVLLVTSAFSAGNSYTYCSSRTLYGFALEGYAPKFLTATTKNGVPLYCVLISLAWALLSFLQLGEGAAQVLNWIINIITSCQLLNFSIMCLTFICFYYGLKAQNIDRNSLPFRGWFQPYAAIFGLFLSFSMIFISSYYIMVPGGWDYQTFLFTYLMIFIDVAVFIGYKIFFRTKWKKSSEIDLTTGLREIENHERLYYDQLEKSGKLQKPPSFIDRISFVLFGSSTK